MSEKLRPSEPKPNEKDSRLNEEEAYRIMRDIIRSDKYDNTRVGQTPEGEWYVAATQFEPREPKK